MWYISVMPQCLKQRTGERAQLLSAMTHPSAVLNLDAKQSSIYIYIYNCRQYFFFKDKRLFTTVTKVTGYNPTTLFTIMVIKRN